METPYTTLGGTLDALLTTSSETNDKIENIITAMQEQFDCEDKSKVAELSAKWGEEIASLRTQLFDSIALNFQKASSLLVAADPSDERIGAHVTDLLDKVDQIQTASTTFNQRVQDALEWNRQLMWGITPDEATKAVWVDLNGKKPSDHSEALERRLRKVGEQYQTVKKREEKLKPVTDRLKQLESRIEAKAPVDSVEPPAPSFSYYHIDRTEEEILVQTLLAPLDKQAAITAIQGNGGVGKTWLARDLASEDRIAQCYGDRIFWFNFSDDRPKLESRIAVLAKELGLAEETATTKEAVAAFKAFLEKQEEPYLIVFDNAGKRDSLSDLIPTRGAHILVTTRFTDWPAPVSLTDFVSDQSRNLIREILGSEDSWEALAEAMGHHPLGLTHACALIKRNKLNIPKFLERLDKQKKGFLQSNQPLADDEEHRDSVHALWKISLDELRNDHPKALSLLASLSYLAPDAIPTHLVERLADSESIETLLEYALIQKNGEVYSIHRLLKMVVQSSRASKEHFKNAIQAFSDSYSRERDRKTLEQNKLAIPHGYALIEAYRKFFSKDANLKEPFADGCYVLAHIVTRFGSNRESFDLCEEALEIYRSAESPNSEKVAQALYRQGVDLWCLQDPDGARKKFEESLEHIPQDSLLLRANVLNYLGMVLRRPMGDEEANKKHQEAYEILLTLPLKQDAESARILNDLGRALHDSDPKQAKQYHERALKLLQELYGDDHLDVAHVARWLGLVLRKKLNDLPGALPHLRRAHKIRAELLGKQHPATIEIAINLGAALRLAQQLAEAQQFLEEALTVKRRICGNDSLAVAHCLSTLATVHRDAKQFDRATQLLQEALSIAKLKEQDKDEQADFLSQLGEVEKRWGRLQNAATHFQKAYSIAMTVLGPDHSTTKAYRKKWQDIVSAPKGKRK